MRDFDEELKAYGLTRDTYEECLKDIQNKTTGLNDMDWLEIVDKYNLPIHYDTLRKASQTIFGNVFVMEYFKEKKGLATEDITNGYLADLKQTKIELSKERQKVRDERTDYQRSIREEARKESFLESFERIFEKTIKPLDVGVPSLKIDSDDDMIVCLSDIHAGIQVRNFWNTYDKNILEARLKKYFKEIVDIQQTHKCKICNVVLGGDEISGLIHVALRLQNNENVIEQLKMVIEYIGDFISALQPYFEKINVYGIAGNHSRISPNKEDSLTGENLEEMILYCLKLKFTNNEFINIREDEAIDNTMVIFETRGGKYFYLVHGDKDSVNNVVPNLTLMTGVKPDCVIMGHRHHNAMETIHGVRVVQCGCVVGMDDYCVDKRISGKPEQVVIITNRKDAVKCMYNVELSED